MLLLSPVSKSVPAQENLLASGVRRGGSIGQFHWCHQENCPIDPRACQQNLYLKLFSLLLPTFSRFDVASTPLVTFRRIDLLSKDELISIHKSSQPENVTLDDTSLFSEDVIWTFPVTEYFSEFSAPLPRANYATIVVCTAGHWTNYLFPKVEPPGMEGILRLFEVAMG